MPAIKTISVIQQILQRLGWPFVFIITVFLSCFLHLYQWLIHASLPRRLLRFTALLLLTLTVVVLALSTAVYFYLLKDLPHPQVLASLRPPQTSRIFDRHGQLLYQLYTDENRTSIKINDLPTHIIQAHLAIEDANFFKHYGISTRDIARATLNNLSRRLCQITDQPCPSYLQGASTITQQLIKNVLLTPERSVERKIQEAYLALWVEQYYSKQQILELYLNQISYGGTSYGIEAASQTYFGKPAQDLTLAESALLAGLPAAPSAYSPFGSDPAKAITRQKQVLNRMLQENYISPLQYTMASVQELEFASPRTDIRAPHFVMYTREQLEKNLSAPTLYQGGLTIQTTLDYQLQIKAQEYLQAELSRLKHLNVTNGAVLITRPQTGEILAMVGSLDYFDIANQGNVNATLRPRQPGSTIKPLTYAAAMELSQAQSNSQFTAATIIDDSPVVFRIPGSRDYRPQNYDGQFHGRVTLRTALASSYNIPAVKILHAIGVNQLVQTGRDLGLTTWEDSSRFGLSLTLGAGEVTLADMAVAYGTFANLGYRHNLEPITFVTNNQNETIYPHPSRFPFPQDPKLDPRVSYIINDILSDPQARAPTFGTFSKLNIPNHIVAVKTGTSNDLRDNWTIGYTPDFLVAVWVGNFNNTPMSRIASGITGATPVWNQIMTHLLTQYQPDNLAQGWTQPEGLVQSASCRIIDREDDQPSSCVCNRSEWFVQGTQPKLNACTPDTADSSTRPSET